MSKTSGFPIVAKTYAKGWDLTSGPENPDIEKIFAAENVRFSKTGGCQTRPGFTKKVSIGTAAAINSIYSMAEYDVMFCKTGTKVYQSVDGTTWYDTGLVQTSTERPQFREFRKDLFITNATDAYTRVAVSALAANADVAGGILTIRAGDIGQFTSPSGTVYIRGIAVSYTGVSGNTLTGTSGSTSAMLKGDIVTQTSTPASGPKGTCIADFQGQILVGGVSADPTILYFSAPSTALAPQYAYDFVANGTGSKGMHKAITGLATGAEICLIGYKKGIDYASGFDTEAGGLITKTITSDHPVPNAFCMTYIENNVFAVFTGKRVLLITKTLYGVLITEDPQDPTLDFDYPIRAYLATADADQSKSFIHFEPGRRELKVSIIVNGISQMLVCNIDLRAWSLDTSKPYGCMTYFILNDQTFAGSDNQDFIYLEDNGVRDDVIPTHHRILTLLYVPEEGRITNEYSKVTFAGLINPTGSFSFRIYIDGILQSDQTVTGDFLIQQNLMTIPSGLPLAGGTMGTETIGPTLSQDQTFQFTYPYEFLFVGQRYQMEWEIFNEGTVFELRNSRVDDPASEETLELLTQ